MHFNSSKQGKGSLGLQDEPNWRHQQSMLAQQAAQGRHQASYAGYQTESASSSSRPGGLNIVRHVPEGSLQGRPHPMHLLGSNHSWKPGNEVYILSQTKCIKIDGPSQWFLNLVDTIINVFLVIAQILICVLLNILKNRPAWWRISRSDSSASWKFGKRIRSRQRRPGRSW